jgi:hypothetical protein
MKWQYDSICRGGQSVLERLQEEFPDETISDYITFHALRNYGNPPHFELISVLLMRIFQCSSAQFCCLIGVCKEKSTNKRMQFFIPLVIPQNGCTQKGQIFDGTCF